MPLSESAQAEARSLILRVRPGASDKCISAVYSLSDMPWPLTRSASRARGTVRAARDPARRNASSSVLSGSVAGPGPLLAMKARAALRSIRKRNVLDAVGVLDILTTQGR